MNKQLFSWYAEKTNSFTKQWHWSANEMLDVYKCQVVCFLSTYNDTASLHDAIAIVFHIPCENSSKVYKVVSCLHFFFCFCTELQESNNWGQLVAWYLHCKIILRNAFRDTVVCRPLPIRLGYWWIKWNVFFSSLVIKMNALPSSPSS